MNLKRNTAALTIRIARLAPPDKKKPKPADKPPCPICQEPVGTANPEGVTEGWSSLPCGHRFGSLCIKRWLGMAEQACCPVCREDVCHACGHPVLPTPVGDSGGRKKTGSVKGGASLPVKVDCGFCAQIAAAARGKKTGRLLRVAWFVFDRRWWRRRQRRTASMDNWERSRAVVLRQEMREDWEDWWDLQEPQTLRDRSSTDHRDDSMEANASNSGTGTRLRRF